MHCVECPTGESAAAAPPPIETGTAGRSARQEHDRRAAKREAGIEARWGTGRVGRLVKRFSAEPQSTRAWAIGAWGEEKLADALVGIEGLRVLHDRVVPGTRGNIDHIAITLAGVFVVDAKAYEGLIEIRTYGWFWKPDWRLTVGRRDKSKLATGMTCQVEAVRAALEAAGFDPMPPVTPVLCFVEGRWPFFRPPEEYAGVAWSPSARSATSSWRPRSSAGRALSASPTPSPRPCRRSSLDSGAPKRKVDHDLEEHGWCARATTFRFALAGR
jgi:hypothetical protein